MFKINKTENKKLINIGIKLIYLQFLNNVIMNKTNVLLPKS